MLPKKLSTILVLLKNNILINITNKIETDDTEKDKRNKKGKNENKVLKIINLCIILYD